MWIIGIMVVSDNLTDSCSIDIFSCHTHLLVKPVVFLTVHHMLFFPNKWDCFYFRKHFRCLQNCYKGWVYCCFPSCLFGFFFPCEFKFSAESSSARKSASLGKLSFSGERWRCGTVCNRRVGMYGAHSWQWNSWQLLESRGKQIMMMLSWESTVVLLARMMILMKYSLRN